MLVVIVFVIAILFIGSQIYSHTYTKKGILNLLNGTWTKAYKHGSPGDTRLGIGDVDDITPTTTLIIKDGYFYEKLVPPMDPDAYIPPISNYEGWVNVSDDLKNIQFIYKCTANLDDAGRKWALGATDAPVLSTGRESKCFYVKGTVYGGPNKNVTYLKVSDLLQNNNLLYEYLPTIRKDDTLGKVFSELLECMGTEVPVTTSTYRGLVNPVNGDCSNPHCTKLYSNSAASTAFFAASVILKEGVEHDEAGDIRADTLVKMLPFTDATPTDDGEPPAIPIGKKGLEKWTKMTSITPSKFLKGLQLFLTDESEIDKRKDAGKDTRPGVCVPNTPSFEYRMLSTFFAWAISQTGRDYDDLEAWDKLEHSSAQYYSTLTRFK